MSKKLKPGQRCTNSLGVCGANGHYYHKPFDVPGSEDPNHGGRCKHVGPPAAAAPPPGAARAAVYAAQNDTPLTIGEFILMLSEYVDRAKHEWTTEKKPEMRALDMVRKVAGIAVNCMEKHGAPRR